MTDVPWTARPGGLLVAVRLTPKSARDGLEGIERLSDGRAVVKARVRAVPEDGKANAALCKLLAVTLDLPGRDLRLESGATARLKGIFVAGDPVALAARLATALRPA